MNAAVHDRPRLLIVVRLWQKASATLIYITHNASSIRLLEHVYTHVHVRIGPAKSM